MSTFKAQRLCHPLKSRFLAKQAQALTQKGSLTVTKQPTDSKMPRRNYTDKERRELLRLVKISPNICHAADKLGIARSTAIRWNSEHQKARAITKAKQSEAMRKLRTQRKRANEQKDAAPLPGFVKLGKNTYALAGEPPAPINSFAQPQPTLEALAAKHAGGHGAKGSVTLSAAEASMLMALVRECLRTSKDLSLVRDAAQLALRLLP